MRKTYFSGANILSFSIFLLFFLSSSAAATEEDNPLRIPIPNPGPTPKCTEDSYTCTGWNTCTREGLQTRTCILRLDCPSVITPPPLQSQPCTYNSESLKRLKCQSIPYIGERIECRLKLVPAEVDEEYGIAYMPEECRMLSDDRKKEECVSLYGSLQECWSVPEGSRRMNCARRIIGITNINEQQALCDSYEGKERLSCSAELREKVYTLVKFRIQNLEKRAETLLEQGRADHTTTLNFIARMEMKKNDFNSAKTPGARRQILMDVRTHWAEYRTTLKTEAR